MWHNCHGPGRTRVRTHLRVRLTLVSLKLLKSTLYCQPQASICSPTSFEKSTFQSSIHSHCCITAGRSKKRKHGVQFQRDPHEHVTRTPSSNCSVPHDCNDLRHGKNDCIRTFVIAIRMMTYASRPQWKLSTTVQAAFPLLYHIQCHLRHTWLLN